MKLDFRFMLKGGKGIGLRIKQQQVLGLFSALVSAE